MNLPGMPNSSEKQRQPSGLEGAWRRTAWIAGLFSALVGLVMLGGHLSTEAIDPLKSPELKELKEKLRLNPADDQVKQQIRALDLEVRERYFRQLAHMDSGVYVLLAGVAVFVFAFSKCASYQKRLPMPKPKTDFADEAPRTATLSRWSVAATGIAVGALLLGLSLRLTSALPEGAQTTQKLAVAGTAATPASDTV